MNKIDMNELLYNVHKLNDVLTSFNEFRKINEFRSDRLGTEILYRDGYNIRVEMLGAVPKIEAVERKLSDKSTLVDCITFMEYRLLDKEIVVAGLIQEVENALNRVFFGSDVSGLLFNLVYYRVFKDICITIIANTSEDIKPSSSMSLMPSILSRRIAGKKNLTFNDFDIRISFK